MTKTKTKITAELSRMALNRLIQYADKNRGTIKIIVDKLTEMTGQTQYRQNVEEWLETDEKKRVEPRLGIALALLCIGAQWTGPLWITAGALHEIAPDGISARCCPIPNVAGEKRARRVAGMLPPWPRPGTKRRNGKPGKKLRVRAKGKQVRKIVRASFGSKVRKKQ